MHKEASKIKKPTIARELMLELYRSMILHRRFEERVNLAYTQQKFSGFCHLHIGVDGLSLYFVLLTTFTMPICILAS